MSVITKDLGIASAYGYAKSKGYTGTEEEFAELMASYADVAQQAEAAAQDAEDAKDAAVSAKNDAQTAQTAAESAQAAAAGSAQTASTKASEASNSAQSAAGSASAAQTSATAASGSASTAQTAAQTATNKASEASSSASAASTAKTGAETARTGAQTAQANAEAAASSVSASAAQIETNKEDIVELKNDFNQFPNGNYPQMGAGYANQLVSGLKKEDQTPYNFRRIPYDATLEEVKKIVGGTVAWNQLVGTTDTSITVQSGHKAYKSINGTASVFTSDGTAITVTGGTDIVIDLTQMFGTTIADYALSLETATAGAGVAWLKKHFPAQFDSGYQAYDAGSLQSVSGLTDHKMVGFNQWDEETELGEYNISTGAKQTASGKICASNYISVLPDTTYYVKTPSAVTLLFYDANKEYLSYVGGKQNATFTTPTNAHFMTFGCSSAYGATYNHDICINFHWDGEKDGTYEPYKTWSYALDDSVTLRGIPKLDSNNNLYYDGDEYLPDGTVNRRYGIVDLGTLNWSYESNYSRFNPANGSNPNVKIPVSTDVPNAIVPLFRTVTSIVGWASRGGNENLFCIDETGYLRFYTTQYSSAESFKTAMSGVLLVYELDTPTTETALPYQETQIVDDFGTEEFILTDGVFPVPVGHETYYQNNLRAKLEMSPDSPDGDGLYVVQQESGENTYVPLASTSTIQDILTRLTALENA